MEHHWQQQVVNMQSFNKSCQQQIPGVQWRHRVKNSDATATANLTNVSDITAKW